MRRIPHWSSLLLMRSRGASTFVVVGPPMSAPTATSSVRASSASVTLSDSMKEPTFAEIDAPSSVRKIPAASLSISSTGQYVIPSPYERQRPQYTAAASRLVVKSRSNLLLPMPGGPSRVSSAGRPDERTVSQRSRRSASSASRPTSRPREVSRRERT